MSIFEYDEEKEIRLMRQAEQKHWMQEGIQQGHQQSMEIYVRNLMETMKLNLNQAMDALKIPAEEQAAYAARIRNQ